MNSEIAEPDTLVTLIGQVSNRLEADIYVFTGPIEQSTVAEFLDLYPTASKKKNCVLVLTTHGGSPDAAFVLARFLKRKYAEGTFTLYLPGRCKSAGTLIALGADTIVMSPHGEMGPLDIQLAKEDSLWDRNSGLDIFAALGVINVQAYTFFENQFSRLITRTAGQITTRTAADIATNIATQLLTPITAQIDPLRLGATHRAVEIARQYGELLDPHRSGVVDRLITSYPSHSFVIDYGEAQELFGCVREPGEDEAALEEALRIRLYKNCEVECVRNPHPEGIVLCLTKAPATQRELPIHADHSPTPAAAPWGQPDAGEADGAGPAADTTDRPGLQRDIRAIGTAVAPTPTGTEG